MFDEGQWIIIVKMGDYTLSGLYALICGERDFATISRCGRSVSVLLRVMTGWRASRYYQTKYTRRWAPLRI